jgi:hypothetical protein
MENNKTRGYLPQECVSIILDIYNIQNKKWHDLLNEIELFGFIDRIHLKTKLCSKCKYTFLNLNNDNFIHCVSIILNFKIKNNRLVNNFFKAFEGFPCLIEEVKAHDLLYNERYQCEHCKQIICYGCTVMCSSMNSKNFFCPICNCISDIEKYYAQIDSMIT